MKEKIFQLLKTKYASLGLGDEILQAHAEMLANMGFVTEDNVEAIVSGQEGFLKDLQKANDKRASEAAKTAKENAKKEFDEEQAKKEAAAKEAAEKEAKEKAEKEAAEKEAKEAKEKAEKEAAEKARKEEEERKRLEEMNQNKEIPDYVKKMQEELVKKIQEERNKADEERKAFSALLEEFKKSSKEQNDALMSKLSEASEQNKTLTETINTMKAENEKVKAEKAASERQAKILSIAKELGIPQYRIDEGLPVSDDMDDDAIRNKLNVVATNCKSVQQTRGNGFSLGGEKMEVSEEEAKAIAAAMCK